MIHVAQIAILVATMAAITACGGSDSGETAGQVDTNESPALTAVSNEGQVVAGAAFGGGVQSSSATPIKSTKIVSPHASVQSIAIDLLVSKIVQDARSGVHETSQVKTITTSTNPQSTAGTIKFVDERVAVGNGHVTFNGEISAEQIDDLNIVGGGTLTAKQESVSIPVEREGVTYSENVDGTIVFEMSLAITFTKNSSGQFNGYKTKGDATIKGSDIKVTGDVSGSVLSMNAKYHHETVDDINGTTLMDKSCGGYLSVEVNGERAVCGVLSTCDGCKQP